MYRVGSNKLTRIVFTLEEDALMYDDSMLEDMIKSGMDIVRIELITSPYKSFSSLISKIYSIAASINSVISIILEVPSNYRVALGSGDANVDKGEIILLVVGENTIPEVGYDYKKTFRLNVVGSELSIGEKIIFGDEVGGEILAFTADWIVVKILDTGTIYNKSRVKINNNCKLTDGLSEKQLENIKFACESNVDFIAFSFSSTGFHEELNSIKSRLQYKSKIVCRLEEYIEKAALNTFIEETDCVLVARYPMGTEMPIEKICTYQKEIVKKCNEKAKPVLISGHVLGSLRSLPYPLRADACDVYNGVIDGVDGFVLSSGVVGENCWKNTMEMLTNILATAETEVDHADSFKRIWINSKPGLAESLASSAVKTAIELSANYIVVIAELGEMGRLLAKYRPPIPIISITNSSLMAQQSLINRGIIPIIEDVKSYDEVVRWVQANLNGTVVVVTDSSSCNHLIGVTTVEKPSVN
jgi:pyruvate kinase